jgi:hypothetical protein
MKLHKAIYRSAAGLSRRLSDAQSELLSLFQMNIFYTDPSNFSNDKNKWPITPLNPPPHIHSRT